MIDTSMIPECVWMDVARKVQSEALKFFKDPENKNAYEKWAAERRKKHAQANEA